MTIQPIVTHLDHVRLRSLLDTELARHTPIAARLLAERLSRARIVTAEMVPPDVVTMNSRIECASDALKQSRELALVYPWASVPGTPQYSILSRIGVDLLGTAIGDRILIEGRTWKIVGLSFQPEAERSFHL